MLISAVIFVGICISTAAKIRDTARPDGSSVERRQLPVAHLLSFGRVGLLPLWFIHRMSTPLNWSRSGGVLHRSDGRTGAE
ncbi:hypothetical protein Dsin_002073 [Dipteronia sinensis]|uniref:Uncharacterized protein n=1 Tax=Dipteronia sinensis TaxID=43782 RepID=A0AAE0B5G2_9ROSI|nr:hypothetical protein Dsin_002073 [Dipteronia sinensis]